MTQEELYRLLADAADPTLPLENAERVQRRTWAVAELQRAMDRNEIRLAERGGWELTPAPEVTNASCPMCCGPVDEDGMTLAPSDATRRMARIMGCRFVAKGGDSGSAF